jgi:hypothetical protein
MECFVKTLTAKYARNAPESDPGGKDAKFFSERVTVQWIARRLHLGTPGYLNHLLYRRPKNLGFFGSKGERQRPPR